MRQLSVMQKAALIIGFVLGFFRAYPQDDSSLLSKDTLVNVNEKNGGNTAIKTVIYATGYVGVTLLCYRYLDTDIKDLAQANQNETVTSIAKTFEQLGTGTSNIIITAATGATSLITKNKKLQKTTILLIGGHIINDIVTNQLKITFQRHRPNTGDPYNTFDWRGGPKENLSFVSAHTSNAFTTATAFATCFKDTKWVPIVAYSAASLVGLCRIYNNAHWASDVLGGAAIGFGSVKAMNGIYALAKKRFSFIPQVDNGHYGFTVLYCLN